MNLIDFVNLCLAVFAFIFLTTALVEKIKEDIKKGFWKKNKGENLKEYLFRPMGD